MEKATIRTEGGLRTVIKIRQHTIISDEPAASGGTDAGAMPPEILLGTVGACMAMTAKVYAERKGWPLEDVEIALEMDRFDGADYADYSGAEPFVHEIREVIVLHGPLDEKQKKRIIEIAGKCPVRRVLKHPTFFIEEIVDEIIEAETVENAVPD